MYMIHFFLMFYVEYNRTTFGLFAMVMGVEGAVYTPFGLLMRNLMAYV